MNWNPARHKRPAAPPDWRARVGRWLLLVAAAALLTLAAPGCGGSDSESAEAKAAAQARLDVIEPIIGCTLDYQPLRGPRVMARKSDLVVRGTIGKPRPGLAKYRSDGSLVRVETDIIPIEVTSVLSGSHGREPGALIEYEKPPVIEVEIDCAFAPPDRAAKFASVAGREVVAYLVRQPGRDPGKLRYAAKPPQPRVREASPEGFLVELASGKGVRNLDLYQRFPGADLADFYPGKPKFPPRKRGQ